MRQTLTAMLALALGACAGAPAAHEPVYQCTVTLSNADGEFTVRGEQTFNGSWRRLTPEPAFWLSTSWTRFFDDTTLGPPWHLRFQFSRDREWRAFRSEGFVAQVRAGDRTRPGKFDWNLRDVNIAYEDLTYVLGGEGDIHAVLTTRKGRQVQEVVLPRALLNRSLATLDGLLPQIREKASRKETQCKEISEIVVVAGR